MQDGMFQSHAVPVVDLSPFAKGRTATPAQALVSRLLVYNHLQRATVHSALRSKWIFSELGELESAYQQRMED
jgi:hypothetical protein